MKHTPGPWILECTNKEDHEFRIWKDGGELADWEICQVAGGLDIESDANARLITAAPEMFKVLDQWVKHDPTCCEECDDQHARDFDNARELINRINSKE